jgi:hypothetical protein
MSRLAAAVALLLLPISVFSQNWSGIPQRPDEIIRVSADTPFVRVFVSCVVNELGEKIDVKVKKIECSICGDSLIRANKYAAIEVLKQRTIPVGIQNGQPIKVWYTLPVIFKYPELISNTKK